MNNQIFGLGSFRLMLAIFVAFSHLYIKMIHGPAAYAVWGFYLLSGYLMSLILNKKYGYNYQGLKSYFWNRALRIYPAYLTALFLGISTLYFLKKSDVNSVGFNPEFAMPETWVHWLHVFTVMPFIPHGGLPVSTSHALGLEFGMYLLAPLICRSKITAWLCCVLTFLVNTDLGFSSSTFTLRYASFTSCLLAFSAGSLLFYYKEKFLAVRMPFASLIIWFLHCLVWLRFPNWPWTFGLYISLIISSWVVLSLVEFKSKFDDFLGDLSYPVYLLHVTIAAIAGTIFKIQIQSCAFCVTGIILTLVSACFVAMYIERPARKIKSLYLKV